MIMHWPILLNIETMGWTIALVGWVTVFLALILLSTVFTNLPKLLKFNLRKRLNSKEINECTPDCEEISGDVSAAIATALHLYFSEMHDEESNILTIKQVPKSYSPWNSKIYGVTNRLSQGK